MPKRDFQRSDYQQEAEDKVKARPKRDGFLNVGDTIRMPHYETSGGFRVWKIHGVHLGATYQESTYHLVPLEVRENDPIFVPCIILETHPEIERV